MKGPLNDELLADRLGLAWDVEDVDERLLRALRSLPQANREALLLSAVGGMSFTALAAELGISVAAVCSRNERACERMRELLVSPTDMRSCLPTPRSTAIAAKRSAPPVVEPEPAPPARRSRRKPTPLLRRGVLIDGTKERFDGRIDPLSARDKISDGPVIYAWVAKPKHEAVGKLLYIGQTIALSGRCRGHLSEHGILSGRLHRMMKGGFTMEVLYRRYACACVLDGEEARLIHKLRPPMNSAKPQVRPIRVKHSCSAAAAS